MCSSQDVESLGGYQVGTLLHNVAASPLPRNWLQMDVNYGSCSGCRLFKPLPHPQIITNSRIDRSLILPTFSAIHVV